MSPEIAMFFACSKFDRTTNRMVPLEPEDIEKTPCGKIFEAPYKVSGDGQSVSAIPSQLVDRPLAQYGFMIDTEKDMHIVKEYAFRHDL